jgi:hypothetical protein
MNAVAFVFSIWARTGSGFAHNNSNTGKTIQDAIPFALFILQPLSQLLSQIALILINLFKLFQDLINPVLQRAQ